MNEQRLLFHEPVVGARNVCDGVIWIASTRRRADSGQFEKQMLGPRGSRTDTGVVPYDEWLLMIRMEDKAILRGLVVRDDSVVPKGKYETGPSDELDNPNTVLNEDEIIGLDVRPFHARIESIDSVYTLDRLIGSIAEKKDAGSRGAVYEKGEILERRKNTLLAIAGGMPRYLTTATHAELKKYCDEQEEKIPYSREAGRLKTAMLDEIIAFYAALS